MYTIKTDFKQPNIKLVSEDALKLINVSIAVAAHICDIDIKDYDFEMLSRIRVIDPINGNLYAIMIDAKNENYEFGFSYYFKYDTNGEIFLHSSDLTMSSFDLFKILPLKDTYPDSIYVNFYGDFEIYSYEVDYRSIIRHHMYENEEYDKTSVVDFSYTIRNNNINLCLDYNEHLRNASPEEACHITAQNVNEKQLMQDKLFLRLLNYVDVGSVAMRELFDYMSTDKIKTATGFKEAYNHFVNVEDREMIESKIDVIRMENI